jgi:hypothetical protein
VSQNGQMVVTSRPAFFRAVECASPARLRACNDLIRFGSTIFFGRQSTLAFGLRSPAFTRSTIRLRFSSATAPKTAKTIFPAGVEVNISQSPSLERLQCAQ